MTRAGILVLCAACNFDSPTAVDAPAGDTLGNPDDRDADGIPNATDLCPDVFDPLQRDHDADRHGDACDRCPHLASDTDLDGDGDGVGDACDPRPGITGDKALLWIGFYPEDAVRIADPTKWQPIGGTWTITDGWVQVTATGVDLLRASVTAQRAVASSRIRLDDFPNGNSAVAIITGLVGPAGAATQFYQCALFRFGPKLSAFSRVGGITISDNEVGWPGPVDDGTIVDVVARFAATFECSFAAPATTVRSNRTAIGGEFELAVQDATASFDYLFVVDAGG